MRSDFSVYPPFIRCHIWFNRDVVPELNQVFLFPMTGYHEIDSVFKQSQRGHDFGFDENDYDEFDDDDGDDY